MALIFRQATADDQAAVEAITTDGRAFLASQGLDQWQGGNPTPECIAWDIAQGNDYLAVDEETGERLGVVAVCAGGEADYDNVRAGAWLTDSVNAVPQEGDGPAGSTGQPAGQPADDPAGQAAFPTYLTLHRIAVSAAARGRGVASFMLRESIAIARERGFKSVRVDTHAGNLPMQGAFLKHGFVRCCDIEITNPIEPNKDRVGFELVL